MDLALAGQKPPLSVVGSDSPMGAGLTHDLQVTPGVVAEWPPQVTVVYRGPDTGMILRGNYVLSLWPIMGSPVLLHVETMQGTPSTAIKVWYHKPGKVPVAATLLSQDKKLACILPDGRDLPLLVPKTTVSFRP